MVEFRAWRGGATSRRFFKLLKDLTHTSIIEGVEVNGIHA